MSQEYSPVTLWTTLWKGMLAFTSHGGVEERALSRTDGCPGCQRNRGAFIPNGRPNTLGGSRFRDQVVGTEFSHCRHCFAGRRWQLFPSDTYWCPRGWEVCYHYVKLRCRHVKLRCMCFKNKMSHFAHRVTEIVSHGPVFRVPLAGTCISEVCTTRIFLNTGGRGTEEEAGGVWPAVPLMNCSVLS